MKKTLFSICAFLLALTASAQRMDTPAGTLIDNMYRTSDSWKQKSWTGTAPGRYEGLVSKIVVGDDGCLYVYNPLSGLDSKSWLKLDKVSDGQYKAVLPQDIHKDDNGDDDDDESGSERILQLNRLQLKGNDKYEVVANGRNYMEFTWDGKTLTMQGVGSKREILGMTYKNVWEDRYGDWAVTIQTLEDKLVTPPASARKEQYTLTSREVTSPRIVEAAVDGNDLYLKGIFKSAKLAGVWVKLTKDGDKYVMQTNQYLGTTKKTDFKSYSYDKAEYHTYAAAFNDAANVADHIGFSVDAASGVLTADNILGVVQGRSSAKNLLDSDLESYENLVLTPYQHKAAKPETPKLHYCSAAENYDYTTTTTTLAFYVKNVDVEGKYLDPAKMYYNVYVNDSKEPFKFLKAKYTDLEKDMTDIPFSYKDKRNYDIKVVDNQRIIHFYDASVKKLSVVMVYEEDGKKYSSDPMTAPVVTAGIEDAAVNKNATEKYYTVDGRRLQHLQRGLNIVKSSDGTTRKVLVK